MKKALYVATVDIHIKSFHLPYLKLLHDNGYEVHVATNGDEEFPYCDVKHKICIERSPFRLSNIKAIKQLKKIIENEQFQIVHCHTPMGAVVARLASRQARKKNGTRVIYTAHGFHFYKGAPLMNWIMFYPIEKWLSRYTDTLITINKEDYKIAKKKFNHFCKNVEYIPGVGIDVKKFESKITDKERKELLNSVGLKDSDYIITCVARLDKNKNQGFLIEVMSMIERKYNNIHLLLVGPDELDGYYQKLVLNRKIKNVHFLGRRNDVPNLLSISDIVVSASLREGLPVNVMEALAAEKPVVALNCRGMKDLISNNSLGYIVDNGSYEEFYNDIINIYNNGFDATKLRRKAKEFSIDKILQIMKKIYFNR